MKFRCEQYPQVRVNDGQGVRLKFVDGEYETSDKAEIEALTALAPLVKAVMETERKPAPKRRVSKSEKE